MKKYADGTAMSRFWYNLKLILNNKSDLSHTHTAVNGYTIQVSATAPNDDDDTIITFVSE